MENNINEEIQNASSDVKNNQRKKRNKVLRIIGLIMCCVAFVSIFLIPEYTGFYSIVLVIVGVVLGNVGKNDSKESKVVKGVVDGIGCFVILFLIVAMWVLYHILFKWLILEWVDKNF